VAARELVVGTVAVVDKRFDGGRNAELVLPALRGVVDGDDVLLQGEGQFDTAGTAANKTVQIALSLSGADAGNYRLVDGQQLAVADISDLPGRNAVDAVTQPTMGGNGTRSGATDTGTDTSPGAIVAVNGAMGGLTASAEPRLGGTWADPTGDSAGSAGAEQGVGAAAGEGQSAGADGGVGADAGEGRARADAEQGSRDGEGAGPTDFGTEQMLRNDGGVSIAVGGEALEKPQVSVLLMFTEEGRQLGLFRVDDLGDSLALHPVADEKTAAPSLEQHVRARAATRVKIDEDHVASLRLELLEDGTLHIVASSNATSLGADALAAYGLSALKRQAGIQPQQVRAVVLGFAD
jgi:hypothetical protein